MQNDPWFVVTVGKDVGVFNDFNEMFDRVFDYTNAQFRYFRTSEEAMAFWTKWSDTHRPASDDRKVEPPKPTAKVDFVYAVTKGGTFRIDFEKMDEPPSLDGTALITLCKKLKKPGQTLSSVMPRNRYLLFAHCKEGWLKTCVADCVANWEKFSDRAVVARSALVIFDLRSGEMIETTYDR